MGRRFTSAQADALAVRELDAEIDAREHELEALRNARTMLAGAIAEASGRCDQVGDGSTAKPFQLCSGPVWSRWCRTCGVIVRRCAGAHGGLDAATEALQEHQRHEHGARAPRKQTR